MKIIALLPIIVLLVPSDSAISASSDVRGILQSVIRRWDLQTTMPGGTIRPAGWLDWLNFDLPPDLLRLLLWGAVILGVLVTLWSLRDSLPVFSRSRTIVTRDEAFQTSGSSGRMEEAQIEADDLARQGRYGEAMHLLLLKSLTEIRRGLGVSFAVSLTSREILRRVQLPDLGRDALSGVVQSVERTYYGGRSASQEDYIDCRTRFDILKQSLPTVIAA